ncbi:hypothetical protein GQF61_16875 [Sphingobacterium sp. DK4209]|uniref:CcoQ/FixQ family Cbb3-type cytochrome c oxidase assembly chaperone n=1 Tax=Sphingobacterium zhuxiongii TaxID=2662364 RepID=A0A5Q0QAN1_9SPHI|nr:MULTISPECIES: hypothetical protein [unclassified Sphingobacterium]MVZ67526.1 hypothetical protein [Sphingobacterium sp. DK4209]QGA27187.1 hypothetical protein GFH32_13065 [Sphingobacterium sp. dk4302]
MFKQITNLNGDEIYLIVSLCIFLGFFILVSVMLFTMKKNFVDYMKGLPLEESDHGLDKLPE